MKRSKHSLSNYKLLSCDMGELVPCGLLEVLPGDTIQHSTSALVRCSPMLAPVMHPVHMKIHHFFVPFRLIWDDFEKFITGGDDGMFVPDFPTRTLGSVDPGDLSDYLGLPPGAAGQPVSVLPFRAYSLIYNEFYRDQDLQDELVISKASGVDTTTNVELMHANWEKDYFTASRPWEQKGPQITIPIGTSAPINNLFSSDNVAENLSNQVLNVPSGTVASAATYRRLGVRVSGAGFVGPTADLSGASAITINRLREAMALQRFEEARARYGSRYVEYLRYLGVSSSDARLQRPEYLGGGKQTLQFSEVLQTAEGTDPVGEMRGHGIGAMRSNRYRRFIEEHGYIMSFLIIRPRAMYMQGIPRTWNRRTKEDFWQRELQHIGQQEVKNKELYADHTDPDETFGYQDRYDDYRHTYSTVAGEFQTSVLDHWHLARNFASDPALNDTFVECVPTKRVFASSSTDTLYVMAQHSIQARRLIASTGHSFIF